MTDIAKKTMEIHNLVADLSSEDRRRIFSAVTTLCGDIGQAPPAQSQPAALPGQPVPPATEFADLHPKAARWLTQNKISRERIDEFFHTASDQVELILVEMPGKSQREQTVNCFLLSGIRSLLATGEPTFEDSNVMSLCKKFKCHNRANHAAYRRQSSNYFAGDKDRGFVLSAPGLKAAAELIRASE